jgi:MFS transporter, UMF1 family
MNIDDFPEQQAKEKKVQWAWAMFDWANSAYALVITAAIFPIYFNHVTAEAFGGNMVSFFGFEIRNTVLYMYSISFSYLVIACLSPLLSGIADFGGSKLRFMKFFTWLGGLSCIGLFFFTGFNIEYGIAGSVLASIGFAGGIVFYNAYLPEIAREDDYDRVSARGFSLGYFGSVLLLVLNLVVIEFHEMLGIEQLFATRLSFLMVGVWWIGFAMIPFSILPQPKIVKEPLIRKIRKGGLALIGVWHDLKLQHNTRRFLFAFFFYNMGVQTVLYLAAPFADQELNLGATELILTIIILQIVGAGGAYLFSWVSKLKGNKYSIIVMLAIWIAICFGGYFVDSSLSFYLLATMVGLVMGGIQSLSRATYSKIFPENIGRNTSYFSFYDVLEKLSIICGTATFALITQVSDSMRYGIIALALYFIIGLLFMISVKVQRAEVI